MRLTLNNQNQRCCSAKVTIPLLKQKKKKKMMGNMKVR